MFEPSCHVLCKIGQTKSIATKSNSTRYEHVWSPKAKEEIWKIWQTNSEQICKQPLIKKVRKLESYNEVFIYFQCNENVLSNTRTSPLIVPWNASFLSL